MSLLLYGIRLSCHVVGQRELQPRTAKVCNSQRQCDNCIHSNIIRDRIPNEDALARLRRIEPCSEVTLT